MSKGLERKPEHYTYNEEKTMINQEELHALEAVIEYLMQNERTSYEEYLSENGSGEGHIYTYAETLNNFVNGLYSTGSEPK